MTIHDLALVGVGAILLWATFALGLLAGVSLRRKDSSNDSDSNEKKSPLWWHDVRR